MEVSVGFTDKDAQYYIDRGYYCDESVMGKVYYLAKEMETDAQIVVRYMEYPWISTFEVDGIQAIPSESQISRCKQRGI